MNKCFQLHIQEPVIQNSSQQLSYRAMAATRKPRAPTAEAPICTPLVGAAKAAEDDEDGLELAPAEPVGLLDDPATEELARTSDRLAHGQEM